MTLACSPIVLASVRVREGTVLLRIRVALRVSALLTASRNSNLDTRGPSRDAVVRRCRVSGELMGFGGMSMWFFLIMRTCWSGKICSRSAFTTRMELASSLSPLTLRQGIRSGAGAQSAQGLSTSKWMGELGAELYGDAIVETE